MSTAAQRTAQQSGSLRQGAGTRGPIVVALLYNTNGMATWCWEAAHALRELGRDVLLVASDQVKLPGTPAVEVVRIAATYKVATQSTKIARAASVAKSLIRAEPDGVLWQIHCHLMGLGMQPAMYLLNQSSLVDSRVPCRQAVAAWSYPVDLLSYLGKTPTLVRRRSAKLMLRTALSLVSWWRSDWRAYRVADRVLPVTQKLCESLTSRSVACDLAYPGTFVGVYAGGKGAGIQMLMAAVRLDEPRKRVVWMLEAMQQIVPASGLELVLVGEAGNAVRDAAAKLPFPVRLLGHLQRQDLQQVMRQAHIFCFGSHLDDWGYVLVEAMANGLIPVAPAISPFDEILGEAGACYNTDSQQDFARILNACISGPLAERGNRAWHRADQLFSRTAFGRSLLQTISACC